MSSTTFVDGVTKVEASWLNDVDKVAYSCVTPSQYGVVGDGVVNDTISMQNAFNAAAGKILVLGHQKVYSISSLTIPDGVTLIANGSSFRRLAAASSYAITVGAKFTADTLALTSPGSSVDCGVKFTGNDVELDNLLVASDAVDSLFGVRVEGASKLLNVRIGLIKTTNYRSAVQTFNIGTGCKFGTVDMVRYVTGLYLRDVQNSEYGTVRASVISTLATGGPGNNGLLLESTIADQSLSNVNFGHVDVMNAGEHGVRLGGGLVIDNVHFDSIHTRDTGAAGAGATGGAGFKVLGLGTGVNVKYHTNITVGTLVIEDCSTTGTGIGNFAALQVYNCKGVSIDTIHIRKRDGAFSCHHGLSIGNTRGLTIGKVLADDCKQHGLRFVRVNTTGSLDQEYCENINIDGHLHVDGVGSPVVLYDVGTTIYKNNKLNVLCKGGSAAIRAETQTAPGDFEAQNITCVYVEPGNITAAPPLQLPNGAGKFTVDFTGLWYGSYGATTGSGSIYRDPYSTLEPIRFRINDSWVFPDVASGVWAPVLTNTLNLDSSSVNSGFAHWSRVGNVVSVGGSLLVDPTAAGAFTLEMTLPVPSNFTAFAQAGGTFIASDATMPGSISANATTDKLVFNGNASVTSARNIAFNATYRIL